MDVDGKQFLKQCRAQASEREKLDALTAMIPVVKYTESDPSLKSLLSSYLETPSNRWSEDKMNQLMHLALHGDRSALHQLLTKSYIVGQNFGKS